MSTSNIKVRDVDSYTEGFNMGFQAAEANRRLTSINASIFKSVFYRDYKDSFYQGVASGWQHSFDLKKQKIKDDLKKTKEEEQTVEKEVQIPPPQKEQNSQELTEEKKAKQLQERQAKAEKSAQQHERDDQELER